MLLLDSYRRLCGHALAANADALWGAPCAVLAHDTGSPPRFFYGNDRTLSLFKWHARDMIGLPSHHSAAPDARTERAAMFAKLEAEDIVTGYCGVRIAADGTRFRIIDAVIWNLRDNAGTLKGQAARIDRVEMMA